MSASSHALSRLHVQPNAPGHMDPTSNTQVSLPHLNPATHATCRLVATARLEREHLPIRRISTLYAFPMLLRLGAVQAPRHAWQPSAPDRPLTMVHQNAVTMGAGDVAACVF